MIRLALPCLILALAAGIGCARPNLEVLHTLSPMPMEAGRQATPQTSLALEIMPVRLPEMLQRPQMVQEAGPGALSLMESHRWGNSLDKDIQRILVENIALLTGSGMVVAYPYGERVKATHRIEVDVHRLDGKPGGTLTLQATWMVAPPQGGPALLFKRTTLQRPVQGLDAEALLAAHSQILGDLSREIATGLRSLPAGR
ncbi:MAG: membrane integrity-associated transporter subunit PqiC [Holophagaceae bacterium]|nr:membrane integrity-associated transporter subunit PqiC [Holophagaceae bacterium]